MLQLYSKNKLKIAGLTKYKDLNVESVLSTGDKTLSFLYPAKLSDVIELEGYLRTKTSEFVIKEIQDKGTYKSIKSTLNVEDLEGKDWDRFDSKEQTVTDCLTLALVGTGWTIGTCTVTKKRTVRKTGCSSWDIVQEARKAYRCEMEFDTLNKKINIAETLGADKGCYFTEDLNLKALDIQGNSYDYYTRINAVGKDDLTATVENYQYSNKTKTLYWKDERYTDINSLTEDATWKLNELSKPYIAYSATVIDLASASDKYKGILDYSLGDTVTLISKDKKVKEKQRIVKIIEYPDDPSKNTCEIANTTLRFEDVQKEQQDTIVTVNNITSDNGTVAESAIKVAVEKITINKADIQSLNAVSARVGDLETTRATITQLNATNANITNLQTSKANITDLNAATGRIGILESSTADIGTIRSNLATITTLVNGNLTSNNIQSLVLTSDKVSVANGFIKNAMIDNLDVSKINAGDLSTNKFRIISDSGKMVIADNTIQIKDATRTRVQIGKDASSDYNMYVWDNTGKLMFDATGLKADGIKSKIIRDDMVSDTANIGGSKINITSLITEMNKDTNTSLINASKVNIDLTGQTLDIAFNSLKSNVDGLEIGGRNLLKNTAFDSDTIGWGFGAGITRDTNFLNGGMNTINFNIVGLATNGWRTVTPTNVEGVAGQTYTASCEFFIPSINNIDATFGIGINYFNSGGTRLALSTAYMDKTILDTWRKVSVTGTAPVGTVKIAVWAWCQKNGHFWVSKIKLEKGNKPTDWSPSPEDINIKIEANTTSITVQQGRIDTLISQTSIMQGDITTINDNYSSLSQSVNGLTSTVGSHTTSISTLNTNVGTAQTTANNANTLADSKAKVFTATPTTPYKIGDLWVQGSSGDTMKCKVARASGSYTATDWDKASKYTDDTKANSVASDLSAVTTRVTSAESSITQNTNSIALKVNTSDFITYKNTNDSAISALTTRTSSTESSVSVLQNQIVSKVSQTDINNSINTITIGGKNILYGTKNFKTGWDGKNSLWTIFNGATIDPTTYLGFSVLYKDNSAATSGYADIGLQYVTAPGMENRIENGLWYTLSFYAKGTGSLYTYVYPNVGDGSAKPIVDGVQSSSVTPSDNNKAWVLTDVWTRHTYTFKVSNSTRTSAQVLLRLSYGDTAYVCGVKLEKGTKATDWTPAPEDVNQQIADVSTSIDTKISTAKAEIKQTTDSIALNVTSLQSTTNTLTTQMGNKAETSTVTAISNRTSSLEANVSSITSRVSSVEGTTSTLNGTVTSQGIRLSTAETKLTDSAFTVQINKNSSRVYKFRYIRDWINGSNINTVNHWVELQAINNAGVNLASGKTPTSNASITNDTYITDGVLTSSSYAMGSADVLQYVQIDLGAIYQNIDLLKIWHYYGDSRTYHNTKTEVSEDGVNWLTVFDSSVSGEYMETAYGHTIQLNTNSINTSSTTINETGIEVIFDNNKGKASMGKEGFCWKKDGLSKEYHCLSYYGEVFTQNTLEQGVLIQLPSEFIGKNFDVMVTAKNVKNSGYVTLYWINCYYSSINIANATFRVHGLADWRAASDGTLQESTSIVVQYLVIA